MKTYNRLNNKELRDSFKIDFFSKKQLIYPLFITESKNTYQEITSLPNQYHYSVDKLDIILEQLVAKDVFKILLFAVPNNKSNKYDDILETSNFLNEAIKYIKNYDKRFYLICDICICEYSKHGHCQILDDNNKLDINITRQLLSEISLNHVRAGADMVAPSDMQDSRIKYIREILDYNNYQEIPIMSYSVKFASNYYGPFREAVNSSPSFSDRRSYQIEFESTLDYKLRVKDDIKMGADIIMVKPALSYLDVIKDISNNFNVPIAAYQVSGEYLMNQKIKEESTLNYEQILLEQLYAFKRAGVNLLITYHALEIANIIDERT